MKSIPLNELARAYLGGTFTSCRHGVWSGGRACEENRANRENGASPSKS